MKQLQIFRASDAKEIQEKMDAAYGKMEKRLTLDDVKIYAKEKFCKRIMKNAIMTIVAYESLCKIYKYRKDVGAVKIKHTGKTWIFDCAYRVSCWPNSTCGGSSLLIDSSHKDEIVKILLKKNEISFQTSITSINTANVNDNNNSGYWDKFKKATIKS